MNDSSESLVKWFSDRPQWLQIAASRLCQKSTLSETDISEFATLCRKEADGELPKTNGSFTLSGFSESTVNSLRLCSISDIEGVNALAPRKPLLFGEGNITIIYGSNGSGKSGYVRLLKHICGAREMGTLHPNVYKSGPTSQKACIAYKRDGISKTYTWLGQGICPELDNVDIYDTSYGKVFVDSDDELRYEPPILLFLSSLINICEKVAVVLDGESSRYQSRKPSIPADKKMTPEGIWYENISAKTNSKDIDKYCTFRNYDETEIQKLQQHLTEKAPAEKANQLRGKKKYVDNLILDATKYLKQLSTDNIKRIISAKTNADLKKTAADMAAEKVFSGCELEGIGSDVWKELWEAARNYSVSVAYKVFEYPNVTARARCVLCHQTLTQETKERLLSFENYVKGEMQKAAKEAESAYQVALKTIEELPTQENLLVRIDAAGITSDEFATQVKAFFAELQSRKDQISQIDLNETITKSLSLPKWIEEATTFSKSLGEEATRYDEDAKNDNREDDKKKLNSLQARMWLSEQREAINEEVAQLKLITQISVAKKLTNTQALSMKKGELAEALITEAFVQRFDKELKNLNASKVSVELVKSSTKKGRVLHKIQLRGAARNRIPEILSEGENRIISIASFLADITGKSSHSPIIFDDPISSLDQDYEEAVGQRLIALSQDKQIIVFTHRLSLLNMLQDYVEKNKQESRVICINTEHWGAGEPRDTPLFAEKPKAALNTLIDHRLSLAKKVYQNEGKENYELHAQSLCKEFRILLERVIEYELMSNIIQRYRREVNTKGKIGNLAKITEDDCTYLDAMMTKYSKYEHSQPSETPVFLPEPNELDTDFKNLKKWLDEFTKRPNHIDTGV